MPAISAVFVPENLAVTPGADQVRPIAKISLTYLPPTGQTITIVSILGAVINGVDVVKYFDSIVNPTMVTLGRQLWRGNYKIGIAQRVEHTTPAGVARFSTGALYDAGAAWSSPLPMSARVYRPHGISFPTAFDFLRNGMDPLWSRHEDVAAIAQVVGAMRQAGEAETISMVNVRNTSFVQLVEPVDRFDGPVVIADGAVSDPVPYVDIEVLYDLSSNSRGYLWGVDYVINAKGRVVFLCADAPGRVAGAAVSSDVGLPEQPPAASFSKAVSVALSATSPSSIFVSDPTAKITGFDWFITPPVSPDPSGLYPPDQGVIGKVIAFVPKTSESFVIYDPSVNSTVFNGSVRFQAPVVFHAGDVLKLYRVSSDGAVSELSVTLWLNRRVTLVGPHAHVASGRLNYLWNQIVGDGRSQTLQDKLIVMAGMKARTEKSIGSFATFVEAILGCPLSPFDAFVTDLRQPDPRGYVQGQIDIYGALQEFDITLNLAVKLGDKVALLQSLLASGDGVSIADMYSDPNFLVFTPNGSPPVDDTSAAAYVQSKIVGPVSLPSEFVAKYPTGTATFLASQILRSKSFRIDLGVYASRRFVADSSLQQRIFDAIDVVKPSGTDYWIRLSDGTPVVKTSPILRSLNVSSNLDLPTDYAQRIFNDEVFATSQFYNFYLTTSPGSAPKIGDQYVLSLFDGTSQASAQTLALADYNAHPLFPLDAIYERWAAAINAMAPASTYIIADVFQHMLRIRVVVAPGNLEFVRYTTPFTAFAVQTTGDGTVTFTHAAPALIATDDISRVFSSLDEAIGAMNGYRELFITGGASFANLADFGSGPYDASVVSLANPSSTAYTAAVTPGFGTGARIGRLRLEGFAYSSGGADDGSIKAGFTAAGAFTTGDSISLTVSHSDPAVLPTPVVLTRTMLATDTSMSSVFAGLASLVMLDPTLMQYFTADYPVVTTTEKLSVIPVAPDAAVLSGFTFVLAASGGAPTLYLANSAGSTTGAGPLSKVITPSAPPVMTVSFGWAGFPVRTVAAEVYAPSGSGGGNFFVREIFTEPFAAPGASPITATLTISAGAYGTARPVAIQNMRIVVNDYPEYSRDDNMPSVWDALKRQPFPTTFTDGVVTDPYHQNPPIAVPNPAPDLYYRKNETFLDLTPRLIAPSQTLISQATDDYALIPIYLAGVGASRAVKQTKTGPSAVTINFLAASPILYRDNGDGTFTDLVLGVDYTEASPNITGLAGGNQTARIVGYVKSPDYLYYYQGPRAPSRTVTARVSSAAGVRALYSEPTGDPNGFRAANKDAAGGPIAAPYAVSDYLASDVKDNPAFKTDTESINLESTFSIKRIR